MPQNNPILGWINLSQTVVHAVYFRLLQVITFPYRRENNSLKQNCQNKGKYKTAREFEWCQKRILTKMEQNKNTKQEEGRPQQMK